MSSFIQCSRITACCCMALFICSVSAAYAVMDPSLEIDPQVLKSLKASPPRSVPKVIKRTGKHRVSGVKGPRTAREVRHAAQRIKGDQLSGRDLSVAHALSLKLESPATPSGQDAALRMSEFWQKMMPPREGAQKPLTFQSPTFSLTLDPRRYPVYAAMDGARIVVDQNNSIPPLVRSLIVEKDPSVRIISGSPTNSRKFLSDMLGAAGFYSVEENFVMEFGVDPKLKVHADFKIEKTSESLLKQDVLLLNSGHVAFPKPLVSFLGKQGFTAFEPFALPTPRVSRLPLRQVRQISASNQSEVVDAILTILSVPFNTNFLVDVFSADNNGISLSVKADRYYGRGRERCVVTGFNGDPVTYTLFRILETKGYHVVILDGKDDFRKISEKILASLHVPGNYAQYAMWPDTGSSYSLSMSGFKLEGAGVPGGSLFLTNLHLDRIIRDLLMENGYDVQIK